MYEFINNEFALKGDDNTFAEQQIAETLRLRDSIELDRIRSVVSADNIDWMKNAVCKDDKIDGNIFFSNNDEGVEIAKHICEDCPVMEACREYAINNHIEHGVWGGTSERERRLRLRRTRNI